MSPRHHVLPGFPPSVSPSSHAAEADGFVFLTGPSPRDLDNPEAPLPEGGHPVRTCIGVPALVRGALIEAEAVA